MSFGAASIKNNSSDDEKTTTIDHGTGVVENYTGDVEDPLEDNEVFKKTHDGVDFRTVSWQRASVIFLKGMHPSPRPHGRDFSNKSQLSLLQEF